METEPLKILLNAHKAEFDRYRDLLIKWNKTYNLTSITSPHEILERHFLDSLTPLQYLPKKGSLLDIGTGGGFPGIPLKMVHPALSVTLIDAVQKKCRFCEAVIRELGLKNIQVIHGRAEDRAVQDKIGGSNCVISRATFELKDLIEQAAPYLIDNNSRLISLKGDKLEKEISAAGKILDKYGLKIIYQDNYILPDSKAKRTLIIIGY